MSDLGGGNVRASNGSSRAAGPVPVSQPAGSSTVRTPRDIMKDRNEREARKRAEADQSRRQQDEERRRSAERRAIAAAAGVTPLTSSSQRRSGAYDSAQPSAQRTDPANTGRTPMRTAQAAYPTPSTGGTDEPQSLGRTRASARATDEPRVAPLQPARRPVAPSNLRQSSAPTASNAATAANSQSVRDNQANAPQQRSNASSFPHAFERWEQLSSHWEGLTSYWLHKLESNQDAIARNVPSASAMSRQITDLSAAGANLFHAVVELQRLRASSERKFQRWFFETRNEQEKDRETRGELERALKVEREARQEAVREQERAERQAKTADNMVKEMRRELNISKEEARRAWEELGRREQEERERTMSLKEGMPTVVGGVQVVPMHASTGVSRQGSQSQRPSTQGGGGGGYAPSQAQSQSYSAEGGYYDDRPGSANTDPFTEGGRSGPTQSLHHEPDMPSLSGQAPQYQPYSGSTPATSGSVQTAIPRPAPAPAPSPAQDISDTDQPERFYQQPPRQAQLRPDPSTTGPVLRPGQSQQQQSRPDPLPSPDAASRAARDLRSEPSYVSSVLSTEGTEYEIDSNGHLRRDSEGRPLVYRQQRPQQQQQQQRPVGAPSPLSDDGGRLGAQQGSSSAAATTAAGRAGRQGLEGSEASDEYDVAADVARERAYRERYGRTVPGTAAEAMVGFTAPSPPSALDARRVQQGGGGGGAGAGESGYVYGAGGEIYETGGGGEGVAGPAGVSVGGQGAAQGQGGWETLQTRHHHPTRLSDVIEEEEGSTRGSRMG